MPWMLTQVVVTCKRLPAHEVVTGVRRKMKRQIGWIYADTYTQNMNVSIEVAGKCTTARSAITTKCELGRLWRVLLMARREEKPIS